ncbi:MAG: hypothetical protein ACLVIY_03770 [Anaerobutyricum soehngenii]
MIFYRRECRETEVAAVETAQKKVRGVSLIWKHTIANERSNHLSTIDSVHMWERDIKEERQKIKTCSLRMVK